MLRRMTKIVGGMSVNAERMRRNLDSGRGLVFSGPAPARADGQGHAARGRLPGRADARHGSLEDGRRLPVSCRRRSRRARGADEKEIDEVFRLERYLVHVDAIFARVFGKAGAAS
jgi:adenylosuccinate lyase